MAKGKKTEAIESVIVQETIAATPEVIINDIQDEIIEETPVVDTVVEPEIKSGEEKEYMVVLGTPSYFIIKSNDGLRTIRCSNTYKRGDIVKL